MLRGKLYIITGVTLSQRMMLAAIPVLTKVMLLQVRQMREAPILMGRAVPESVEKAARAISNHDLVSDLNQG